MTITNLNHIISYDGENGVGVLRRLSLVVK